jgi:integrase
VSPPKAAERRVETWEPSTVVAVREALPGYLKAVVDVGCGLGLRSGEIRGLAVEDVDWLHHVVHVRRQVREWGGKLELAPTKTGKEREVPLPEPVAFALSEHIRNFVPERNPSGRTLIFTSVAGGMIHPSTFTDAFRKAVKAAGVHGTPHTMRHTYATDLMADGMGSANVAAALGDTVASVDKFYAHPTADAADRIRAAIERRAAECAPDVRIASGDTTL